MLGENIKQLRKKAGLSQEVLADKLHVVRQTISKWEKGLSVPDADMLQRLAEVFEVSVADLLGGLPEQEPSAAPTDDVARQLAEINEQLAIRNRRVRRLQRVGCGFAVGLLIFVLAVVAVSVAGYSAFTMQPEFTVVEEVGEIEEPDR